MEKHTKETSVYFFLTLNYASLDIVREADMHPANVTNISPLAGCIS